MRGRILFWSLACVALLAVGCDDEDTGSNNNTGDTTPDSTGDTGVGDTGNDPTTDTPVADNGTDTPVEDNGTPDEGQDLPPLPEGCDETSCTGEQACVGGGCVDPVEDLEAYVTDAEGNPASYWFILQLPSLFDPPETCCFDYNGDGRSDDGLGGLLGVLDSFLGGGENPVDVQGTINDSIADGTITLINEWRELPDADGDVKFSIFIASNDVDGDSEPDNTIEEREAGDGVFALDSISFGDFGSQVQFNLGTRAGDTIYAGPSEFQLTLNIDALGEEPFQLNLVDARILAPISIEDDGVHTVDEERGSGEEAFTAGGGQLGGVLEADQLLEFLDDQFRACACAGVDAELPVLTWEIDEEEGEMIVECTDNTGDAAPACGDEDGPLCGNVATVCGFVGLIGSVLDVDRDNDGINESLSAGLRFGLTGATIDGLVPEAPAK